MKALPTANYTVLPAEPNLIPVSPEITHSVRDVPQSHWSAMFRHVRANLHHHVRGAESIDAIKGQLRSIDDIENLFNSIRKEQPK